MNAKRPLYVCLGFAVKAALNFLFAKKRSCATFGSQSEIKATLHVNFLSCDLGRVHAFVASYDWLIKLSTFIFIGHKNCLFLCH